MATPAAPMPPTSAPVGELLPRQAAKKCHQSLVMHRLAADLVVGMEQRLS
jgi:hypothetical protein